MTAPERTTPAILGSMDGTEGGNEYLTATEAARRCGLPERTVRHWAAKSRVGTRASSKGRLVSLADVADLARRFRAAAALTGGTEDPESASAAVIAPPTGIAPLVSFLLAERATLVARVALQDQEAAALIAALGAQTAVLAEIRDQLAGAQADEVGLLRDHLIVLERYLARRRPWWRFWERLPEMITR